MYGVLKNKNFARYFTSGVFANIGFMMQTVAASWLIYRLTGSTFYVGLLQFVKQLMAFLVSPAAGVFADFFDRKKIFMISASLLGLVSLLLGVLVINDAISVTWFLLIHVVIGCLTGIDHTIGNTLIKEIVGPGPHLVSAVAFGSMIFNLSRIIGPFLAGLLIPVYGEGIGYLALTAGSFISVIILSFVKIEKKEKPAKDQQEVRFNYFKSLREGVVYVWKTPYLNIIITFTTLLGLFGFPFAVLLPSFCKEYLGGGSDYFGFITTFMGMGALISALYLSRRKSAIGLERLILGAASSYATAIMVLSFTRHFWLSALCMMWIGMSQVLIFASANTVIQTVSDDKIHGRIMSLYITYFMGATTIGSFLVGYIAGVIGEAHTMLICGFGALLSALYYGLKLGKVIIGIHRKYKRLDLF